MLRARVAVTNALGLHARAAGQLVKLAATFKSRITLARAGSAASADAKSILSVLTLAAVYGTELEIVADGDDEDKAMAAVQEMFGITSEKNLSNHPRYPMDKKAGILGVPLGFGASKVGSELGVTAIRHSQIRGRRLVEHVRELGFEVTDHGDAAIIQPTEPADEDDNPKYQPEMVRSCEAIFDSVSVLLNNDEIPIILGGDHSIAIGTFAAVAAQGRKTGNEVGLIWFDAHADSNTPETSPTGNIHGMPLAVLLGHGVPELTEIGGFSPKLRPQYFAHVGARDIDVGEQSLVHKLELRDNFFTMSDIDRRGMWACMEDALAIVSKAPGGYAVTFDIDVIDPRFAPGSGTLVRGGATYREAHLALEMIADHGGMRSFEIVEVNPMLDQSNITVELACELILSALGKTIL